MKIPFIKAIVHMPYYAKFIEKIVSNEKKLEEYATISLTEECSTVIQNMLKSSRIRKVLLLYAPLVMWAYKSHCVI